MQGRRYANSTPAIPVDMKSVLAISISFILSAFVFHTKREKGFTVLFDGSNLNQWQGDTSGYAVADGVLSVIAGGGLKGSNLYTKKEYADFELRFDFKLTPGANNGIGIRTPASGDAAFDGMEIQVLDDAADQYRELKDYQFHGSVYGVIPAKRGALKPVGEWNSQQIIAKGNHIKVILNGNTILDGDIAKAAANGTADHREHPGLFNKKGHIGLLWHNTPVQFKNIRVKEL